MISQAEILKFAEENDVTINAAIIATEGISRGMTFTKTKNKRIFDMSGVRIGNSLPPIHSRFVGNISLTSNKHLTIQRLRQADLPTAEHRLCVNWTETCQAAHQIRFPLVVKPLHGSHGIGITVGVNNTTELQQAHETAKQLHSYIVVEQYLPGSDYRFLVVGKKCIAVAQRVNAYVEGDGTSTVEQLIASYNASSVAPIKLDGDIDFMLSRSEMTRTSVPVKGQHVTVHSVSNVSAGGRSTDVTDLVHQSYKDQAVAAIKALGLIMGGVDFIINDPNKPNDGRIIEVNSRPELRLHTFPAKGKRRNVIGPIYDLLLARGVWPLSRVAEMEFHRSMM